MNMATENGLDVVESANDGGQWPVIDEAIVVQVRDATDKWRMVQQHQRGLVPVRSKRIVKPGQPLCVDLAVMLARWTRVQRHHTHFVVISAVVQGSRCGEVLVLGERVNQCLPPVVVSRKDQQWRLQRPEQFTEHLVFIRVPFIHQVTGDQDQVG